jgi:ADP-heptose:LPS heptosyltransferase
MNVSAMRRADRWLGVPACAVLTLARRLRSLGTAPTTPARPRRILFVKLAEQGSTVLAHAALTEAVRRVGRENVFFLVFAENRFILDVMDVIPAENVIPIPSHSLGAVLRGAIGAIRRMHREGIDTAIDMEFFARSSAVMSFLSGATWRVGFHAFSSEASYRGDLMTHRLSFNSHLHASQVFQMLVAALDAPPDRLPALDLPPPAIDGNLPRFVPSAEETATVAGIVRRLAGTDDVPPLVLLNANCSDLLPLRRWPPDRYVLLARRLLERYPELRIAFTGAPDEAQAVAPLVRQVGSPRCLSLAGHTTLRQLLVLYTLARVLVTNDSGPAHFAALTPIRVVTMFGPETPHVFGARTPRSHTLWAGISCSPCVNAYNDRRSSCGDNVCMKRITVDEVFDVTCRLYEEGGREAATV